MLKNTFIHLPGVGPRLEQRLWAAGILTWDDFLKASTAPKISPASKARLDGVLVECRARLDDLKFWCRLLPPAEHWRLYRRFEDQCAFLDIETSGLSVDQGGEISLVGLFDGRVYRPFVNGYNLEAFEDVLVSFGLLVTFNGACFDLPFLSTAIRHLRLPPGHIDLRY